LLYFRINRYPKITKSYDLGKPFIFLILNPGKFGKYSLMIQCNLLNLKEMFKIPNQVLNKITALLTYKFHTGPTPDDFPNHPSP